MIWSTFRSRNKSSSIAASQSPHIPVTWNEERIEFHCEPPVNNWLYAVNHFEGWDAERVSALRQMEDMGLVIVIEERACLSWDAFYQVASSSDFNITTDLLGMPPIEKWKPLLASRGALSDADFSIVIGPWIAPDGSTPSGDVTLTGGIVSAGKHQSVLPEACWRIVSAVAELYRPSVERTPDTNRRAWSKIREQALAANADLSDFLRNTVILTPERLRIEMRKSELADTNVIEIEPTFDGAPSRWLEMFDRLIDVPERYDISDGRGITQILLSPEVRTVLREIRRMPGRRIAGDRAEAFVRNPFALLGDDASKVIDPEQFEHSRDAAGISFSRFVSSVLRDEQGTPYNCSLRIEESIAGTIRSDELQFHGANDLANFLHRLDNRIASGSLCFHWQGYDLEILGDTPSQAELLRNALHDMEAKSVYKASDIFNLSKYSGRILGFGVERPYYSPYIAKKDEGEGWFPENVEYGLCYTPEGGGETVAIRLDEQRIASLRDEICTAHEEHRDSMVLSESPNPIPVEWLVTALEDIGHAKKDISQGAFDPNKVAIVHEVKKRQGLVVKPNVESLDYKESRGALTPPVGPPRLPTTLLPHIQLKDYQMEGVKWLQHLWGMSPTECGGALLADDMGLGKTLQLLTFIAATLEEKEKIDPFLIVAPVSLLDNWREEIDKFFVPGTMKVLTLYGQDLAQQRVAKRDLDDELISAGATRLLKNGWLGSAQVVLTTYETLRDLEFSLAAQHWSAIICDEAQKIKNPNALVTRAAKKQNARMRIACTGTPVENTLVDLWCLFDFIQPGLFGALKTFGELYRKPIEASSGAEKSSIEELRTIIEPQKLRRTKAEVAKNLPRKIEVGSCRELQISDGQRAQYADAIATFRRRGAGEAAAGLQSSLGLLHHLRRLCTDPRPLGAVSTALESIAEIERQSPKMSWLLRQLNEIKQKHEKAIVFCEFRDLQRTLQRAIEAKFGFVSDVINGDTSTDTRSASNRQRRIKAFQEGHGFGVIILSPLAVGFGVNMQSANHVIHFTRSWNPAKEDQATDRAYRIGQEKDVYVYYPVVIAHDFKTFDQKLDELLQQKRELSAEMLNGSGDIKPADFGDLEAPDGGNAFGSDLILKDDIRSMSGEAFEAFCAVLWSKQGFTRTIKTPRVGDGGIDIVAIRNSEGVLIQCKSSSLDGRGLGWEAVKDVAAGSAAYAAQYKGITFRMVAVTNQYFNGAAKTQANNLHVELVDGDDIEKMLLTYPIQRGEIAQFLLGRW